MKFILICFLLIPTLSFAQDKTRKLYINPNIILRKSIQWNSPISGAGINAGVRLKNFGIGAGVEYFKVFSDLKAATPIFLDARYFFPAKSFQNKTSPVTPFVAADIGKMIWSTSQTMGSTADNFTLKYQGKFFFSGEAGINLDSKKGSSILFALGFKAYQVDNSGIHRTIFQPNGTTGPLVETKTPVSHTNFSEVFLKIGYNF